MIGEKRERLVMRIIQVKEIEFYQDDRGWRIRPTSDGYIKNGTISDIHKNGLED
ncbi:hypothetical protein S225a_04740 [Candidatus Brocadiaceae bacterium S225]|uniref:Uncharacterized protein n=1 Tax=Candidatus Scalindua brodae TaxID=237368 RepID=A0A0B0EDH0_9BACT|nr:MAG: hypothetical protein SCABRO_02957 [Candidatus Scalindua brodae]TWU36977.1 hypothetical protein S225a_04740 [Candidatus Brocadiaceae bacterium S225]